MKITMVRIATPAAMLLALPAFAGEQIKVVERPVGETTVDLGAKGDSVGDLLVFANGIFDAANKTQVGSDQGYCVRTVVGKSWECFWTLTLKAGQITVEGPFMDEGDSLVRRHRRHRQVCGREGQHEAASRATPNRRATTSPTIFCNGVYP